MKALSYIVASIIMLIITVVLSGTAWLYISGILTGGIQGIDIADSYCSLGEVTLSIKNIGTTPITRLNIEQTYPKNDVLVKQFQGTIEPGKTVQYTDTCEGEQSRKCIYRITPPQGKAINPEADCEGKPSSLVLSLHFDEGSGIAATDSSGNSNNGIFYGESFNDGTLGSTPNLDPNDPSRVNGKFGKALQFDGINDYVNIGNANSLLPVGDKATIAGWYKLRILTGGEKTFVFKRNSRQYGISIDPGSNRFWLYKWASTGWQSIGVMHTTWDTEWHHLAWAVDGTSSTFYLDGSSIGTQTWTSAGFGTDTSNNTEIGRLDTGYYFNGTIDEVRIYNRTLTQQEIQAEMQSSIPITRPVASYSFEESGQYANDTHIWVKGKYGSALSFDGVNDYVNITTTGILPIENEFTYEAWVSNKRFPELTYHQIMNIRNQTNWMGIGAMFYFSPGNGCVYFDVQNATNRYYTCANDIHYYEWVHIVATFKNGEMKTYINGNLNASGTAPFTKIFDIKFMTIGSPTNAGGQFFNGTIDEVRVYSKAII